MAEKSPDTDICTVAQQCMTTVVLMTSSDEARFWLVGDAERAVLAEG